MEYTINNMKDCILVKLIFKVIAFWWWDEYISNMKDFIRSNKINFKLDFFFSLKNERMILCGERNV